MTPPRGPPFWNFSENSSVLEGKGVPKGSLQIDSLEKFGLLSQPNNQITANQIHAFRAFI